MSENNYLDVLKFLVDIIDTELDELTEAVELYGKNGFRIGQMYAYIECLEVLQHTPAAAFLNLDYDIENRYAAVFSEKYLSPNTNKKIKHSVKNYSVKGGLCLSQ